MGRAAPPEPSLRGLLETPPRVGNMRDLAFRFDNRAKLLYELTRSSTKIDIVGTWNHTQESILVISKEMDQEQRSKHADTRAGLV